jgi:hypothetical protein
MWSTAEGTHSPDAVIHSPAAMARSCCGRPLSLFNNPIPFSQGCGLLTTVESVEGTDKFLHSLVLTSTPTKPVS